MRRWWLLAIALLLAACQGAIPTPAPSAGTGTPIASLGSPAVSSSPGSSTPGAVPSTPPPLSPAPPSPPSSPLVPGTPAASGASGGASILVFRDDFSDPESGFATGEFDDQAVRYEDGQLILELRTGARSTWTTRALEAVTDWPIARVEATVLADTDEGGSGYYGLTCGRDNETYLAGLLYTGGGYVVLRVAAGEATVLARDETPIIGLPIGAPVSMAVECTSGEAGSPQTLALDVEGERLATVTDQAGLVALRRAGVYAESLAASPPFRVVADEVSAFVGLGTAVGPVATPTPALATPSGASPTPGDPALAELLSHIPDVIRGGCAEVAPEDPGADASVLCRPGGGIESVRYTSFASRDEMDAAYETDLSTYGEEATGSTCEVGPAHGPYTIGDATAGRVVCFERLGRAWIEWTDERLDILAIAARTDASFGSLYDWWLQAGPIE